MDAPDTTLDVMTRGQIKARGVALAGVYPTGDETPIDDTLVNQFVNERVRILSRITDYTYLTYTHNLVEGQAAYCFPDLRYLEGVDVLDASDVLHFLGIGDTRAALHNVPDYRETSYTPGVPDSAILQGGATVVLYPTPSYSKNNGLILRGFGVISPSSWASDDSVCPLQPRAHMTVCYGVAADVAEHLENYAKAERMEKRWRYLKGHWESEMATMTPEMRQRMDDDGGRAPSGPLDM